MAQQKHDESFFTVQLVRSGCGRQKTQRLTLLGLGLRRLGQQRHLKDTPAIRGMLYKVVHLVTVSRHQGQIPESNRAQARRHVSSQKQGAAHAAS